MKVKELSRLCAALFVCSPAFAAGELPSGSVVKQGSASIVTSGGGMTITTNSERTIINWDSYSVGAGNSVNYVQPSTYSATLNRVTGSSRTEINGAVTSNGQLFILNPNGVLVGPNGQVNAAKVYMGTASISDENFIADNLVFAAPADAPANREVIIQGSVSATYVVDLFSPKVTYPGVSGLLLAPGSDTVHPSGDINTYLNPEAHTAPAKRNVVINIDSSATIKTYDGSLTGGNIAVSGNTSGSNSNVTHTNVSLNNPGGVPGDCTIPAVATSCTVDAPRSGATPTVNVSGTLPNGTTSYTPPSTDSTPPYGGSTNISVTGMPNISVSLSPAPNLTSSSSRPSIKWETFDLGSGGRVAFVQSPTVAVSERFRGNPASSDFGSLTSNGNHFATMPQAPGGVTVVTLSAPPPASAPTATLGNLVTPPRSLAGLLDGSVTVRVSLVDPAPANLR